MAPSDDKIHKNFNFLIPEFATREEVLPIWACAAHRVLSEYYFSKLKGVSLPEEKQYTIHKALSFLELDLASWTKFQGV